jgi:hypothetical protein
MNNPFEALAGRQLTAPVKARIRASEKRAAMKPTPQEQESINQQRQVRIYRCWKRSQIREFAQRHPQVFTGLRRLLRHQTMHNAELTLRFSRYHLRQLKSFHDRTIALGMIGTAIARMRVRNGYPPFDDSLPGELPTVFEIIRAELDCFSIPKDATWA